MKHLRLVALLLTIALLFAAAAPCFAESSAREREEVETFLSVLDGWGSFLARVTGSYGVLDYITRFSEMARDWHDFIDSGGFTPENILSFILGVLGFQWDDGFDDEPDESYSI